MKENIDNSLTKTEKEGTENTTENNNSVIKETSINFLTKTEKSDDLVVIQNDTSVNDNNVVKIEIADFTTTENTSGSASNSETFTETATEDIYNSLINAETSTPSISTTETTALTQPSDDPVVPTEKSFNYADIIENTTSSTSRKENVNDFAAMVKILDVFKTTAENIKNPNTSIYSVARIEKIVDSGVEADTPVTHPDVVNIEDITNAAPCKTEILSDIETSIFTENFSHLVTTTEETDDSMHKTKQSLYHAEIVSTWPFNTADIIAAVESSGKTVLRTEKTVPLVVIVAGNSISLPELNIARNGKISKEKVDPNVSTIKDEERAMKEDNFERDTSICGE